MLTSLIAGDLLPQNGHLPLQLTCSVLCKAQVGFQAGLCTPQEGGFATKTSQLLCRHLDNLSDSHVCAVNTANETVGMPS